MNRYRAVGRALHRLAAISAVLALVASAATLPLASPASAQTIGVIDQLGSTGSDEGGPIAVDGAGNTYLAGDVAGVIVDCAGCTALGSRDGFIRKYGPDGSVLWTDQFGSTGYEDISGVDVDGAGSVYVAGETDGALPGAVQVGSNDGLIRKYASDGTVLWTQQFNLFDDYTGAWALAVDAAGNSYLAGEAWDFAYTTDVAFVTKYDTNGVQQWTRQLASTGDGWATPYAIAVSPGGSTIAVVGDVFGSLVGQTGAGGHDAFMATYAADGTPGWVQQFGTTSSDWFGGVAIDSQGRIDVYGLGLGNPGSTFVQQYASAGALNWSQPFTQAQSVALGPDDSVVVGGYTGDPSGATVAAFAADGTPGWSAVASFFGYVYGLDLGPGGVVYAGGMTTASLPGFTNAGVWDVFGMKVTPPSPATPSATTVVQSVTPSIVGAAVTYSATVSPVPDGGTMAFTEGGTTISGCEAVPVDLVTGAATCSVTYSSVGTSTVGAAYSGTEAYQGSDAVEVVHDVTYRFKVTSRTRVAPGDTLIVSIMLLDARNTNLSSAAVDVAVSGVDPAWSTAPARSAEFVAGRKPTYKLAIVCPADTVAGTYTLSFDVSGDPVSHEAAITVAARGKR